MHSIKVTVIVPVFKVEKYLNRCVDSIINQTYKDLEIILVDDGSPDNCGKICDEYALLDERVIVIHQANAGLSAARNAALEIFTGKYIVFVDSDDWIEFDLVEKCLNAIKVSKADLILFNWNDIYKDKILPSNINIPDFGDLETAISACYFDRIPCVVWNKFYSSSIWTNIRFPENMNMEDLVVAPQVFTNTKSIYYLNETLYNYNKNHTSSIMKSVSTRNKYGKFYAYKVRNDIAIKNNMTDLYYYSRKPAIRNSVTAYSLNTREKVLSKEQVECIKKYMLSTKKDGGLRGVGIKYKVLAYGVLNCNAICKIYANGIFLLDRVRKMFRYE